MVWVSQPCHSLTCSSWTGYKTKPWESFWEQQRTHPLRPCATYWTCHPWKQDIRWSKSRRISMLCRIPLHDAVKEEKGCRMARGKSWMGQAEQSIQHVCTLTELKQVRDWEKRPVEFKPYYKTLLSENLGTHCREGPAGKKQCLSKPTASHMTSWSTHTAQSQGTGLVGSSQSRRVEGLCTKTVEPTGSQPLAWPWR